MPRWALLSTSGSSTGVHAHFVYCRLRTQKPTFHQFIPKHRDTFSGVSELTENKYPAVDSGWRIFG
jgi:hypothetical protein